MISKRGTEDLGEGGQIGGTLQRVRGGGDKEGGEGRTGKQKNPSNKGSLKYGSQSNHVPLCEVRHIHHPVGIDKLAGLDCHSVRGGDVHNRWIVRMIHFQPHCYRDVVGTTCRVCVHSSNHGPCHEVSDLPLIFTGIVPVTHTSFCVVPSECTVSKDGDKVWAT